MVKIVVFGNSGSGKSTLAKSLAARYGARHLDLDVIAWKPETPPAREDFAASRDALLRFIGENESWVIEGCYSDLLQVAAAYCGELIFLNPGVEECVANCRARPWEPHKYKSREAQDANLQMLVGWVREYETRRDEFSLAAHQQLYANHTGRKAEYRSNQEASERLFLS
jgi:adenylate kinase family enzyme